MESTDLYKFLTDSAGNKNANGDYSTTPENFFYTCPDNVECVLISRVVIYIEDNGVISAEKYGAVGTLSNGVQIRVEREGETLDLTDGRPVVSNQRWAELCYDSKPNDYGSGNSSVSVRWTFARSGYPIKLYPGEKFIATLSDDLSGLVDHTFMIQGQKVY